MKVRPLHTPEKEPLDPLKWKLGGPTAGLQHYKKR